MTGAVTVKAGLLSAVATGSTRHAWFTPWDIDRPASGSPLRSYHLARDVARAAGMAVYSPIEHLAAGSPYLPLGGQIDLRRHPRGRYGRLRALVILNPGTRAATGPVLTATCRSLARTWSRDGDHWLVCESAYIAAPLVRLARATGARLVYSSHNCESDVWRQIVAGAGSLAARAGAELAWRAIRRHELALLRTAAATWCCSDLDASLLAALDPASAARTIVVPNGVNAEVVALQAPAASEPATIGFIGYLGTDLVHQGCLFLIDEVMPRVRARLPAARLILAGRDPRPELRLRAGADVEIISPLDNPNDVLRRCRLSVVPLLQGGGTRLKILESLAAGRPVVSTPKGAEGLDLGRLAGVTVAEGAAAFADAVVGEASLPLEAARAEQLRGMVLARHDWQTITSRLLDTMVARFGDPWRPAGGSPPHAATRG